MESIKLEDIRPEASEFHLRKTGKTYKLRPVQLLDEKWLSETFGEKLESIFKEIRMPEICRIVYRLMSEEDKKAFAAQEIIETDESGETKSVRLGGVDLLLTLVTGVEEKVVIFRALLQTIGISRPMQETLAKGESEKKSLLIQFAGAKSSISSPRNTAGRGTTSGRSRRGKSRSRLGA